MRENTEALDKTILEGNNAIIVAIRESSATLSKNLTEAIEKLGTHIPSTSRALARTRARLRRFM